MTPDAISTAVRFNDESDSDFIVEVDDVPGPDFTIYEEFKGDSSEKRTSPRGKPENHSHEGSCTIKEGKSQRSGRGLKCRAYGGNYWSITVRCEAKNKRKQSTDYEQSLKAGLLDYADRNVVKDPKPQDYLGYCPQGYKKYLALFEKSSDHSEAQGKSERLKKAQGEIFLNDIYQLCYELYDILLADQTVAPTGLITLTGATNSSKSLIARGLIFLFLEAAAKDALENKLRKPHLVTFEDPIEHYYIKDPAAHTPRAPNNKDDLEQLLGALNIDYTPREKKKDADKLASVVKDAKRQTPSVLFVGETRDRKDWKDLLDFGGSGHLVITTSHAGSVVEAMTQIFRQTKTETASQRSEIARRILGIVNIRAFNAAIARKPGEIRPNVRALLPAVWKRTSQSVNNLVADGLSSILPALDREWEIGYYGRTYFAHALMNDKKTSPQFQKDDDPELKEKILRKAMEWDIRGV